VSTFDCPDGSDVGEVHRGDRVLATGRDEKSDWIEIRDPRDLGSRVWVNTRYLVPDADLSGLDVRECTIAEQAAAAPTTLPGTPESLPLGVTTTTKKGGAFPGPAPAPGPAPDTAPPSIGAVSANPSSISAGGSTSCVNSSTVTVAVSDASGVAQVSVSWSVPGYPSLSGNGSFGPAGGSNWSGQVGPFPYTAGPNNTPVTLNFTARDNRGNQSGATNTTALKITQCFG